MAAAAIAAVAPVAGGGPDGVAAAAPPTTQAGYVQLVDDTGAITVTVPTTWTDVDTSPIVDPDGSVRPYIAAAPDLQAFQDTFDVPGVLYTVLPFTADPQTAIDEFGLDSGCQTLEVEPYDDGLFAGLAQKGSGCGSGAAAWNMIVASPASQELTALVQLQAASPADDDALAMAGQTFNLLSTAALGVPGSSVVPVDSVALPTVAPTAPAVATTAATGGTATTLPAGFVRLLDDTGTITVVVPSTWSDVETSQLDIDGGIRRIAASPDLGALQGDLDAAGVQFFAQTFTLDAQALVQEYDREGSCAQSGIQPYSDGDLNGAIWLGSGCGPSGQGTWLVIAASPSDQSVTFRVHARTATAADEPAIDTVLLSYGYAGPGSAPPATLPLSNLPAGASAVEVATAFLGALAAGDGAAACALLSPEYIGNFAGGFATCGAELSAAVAGQGAFWAGVQIAGDENTSSESCGDEAPDDGYASLELVGPTDDGCLSIGRVATGEWRVEDLSNSIWNQAA